MLETSAFRLTPSDRAIGENVVVGQKADHRLAAGVLRTDDGRTAADRVVHVDTWCRHSHPAALVIAGMVTAMAGWFVTGTP